MSSPVFVVCSWRDAWADVSEMVRLDNVKEKHKPTVMETIGWLLYEDEQGVMIANERCLDVGEDTYRGITFIPKELLVHISPKRWAPPRKIRQARAKQKSSNLLQIEKAP